MRRLILTIATATFMSAPMLTRSAEAQSLAYDDSDRGPRFLLASASTAKPAPVDVNRTPILKRRLSLAFHGTTVKQALAEISLQSGLKLVYSDEVLPDKGLVRLMADGISVAAALTEVLLDANIDVMFESGMKAALVRRPAPQPTGSLVGRVTNAQSGEAIEGAEVFLQSTRWRTLTVTDGQYKLAPVDTGRYTVTARRIGFTSQSRSVTVAESQEVTADFELRPAITKLDELVTTGTFVPTEVKALPTPVSVISATDIAEQRPQALRDVFRQAVPTAVAFTSPSQPLLSSAFSTRGVSSLIGSALMKVYVDGVEATGFGASAVDPASIERVEVIRGPQAATLYGADAAGGVVQIFTKRGDPNLTRPQVEAEAGLGVVETPYANHSKVLRQRYTASVRGGGDLSYNLGGGYTRLADYSPSGELSRQSTPSVFGGMRYAQGIITADLSARYYQNKLPLVVNPLVQTTGFAFASRPFYQNNDFANETYGARVAISPTDWFRNQVTLGVDRLTQAMRQTQRRLTSPDDTLFSLSDFDSRKISVGYNASLSSSLTRGVAGSVTLGVDHYDQATSNFSTSQALNTEGTIQTSPPGSFNGSSVTIHNTGYFAQAQVNVRDALFFTGGLRAEDNSTFGANLGTPVLPRVGLSYVREVGQATMVKVRGSYGRAIRAPSPEFAIGSITATQIQLANPLLAPEQQQGWDAGVDLVFGNRASLSVTGYDQTAKDLIAFLQVGTTPVPTFQYQNVGRVSNRGVEIEGSLNFRLVQLKVQYGYVRSRIENLGPPATGDGLKVGDEPSGIPAHTAGATLRLEPREGTILTAGLTYVGSYRQTDFLALFSCIGGTGLCAPDFDFTTTFDGFTKINAGLTQRLTRQIEGFLSVENLTNNEAYEGLNTYPVMGRMTMAGLHVSY